MNNSNSSIAWFETLRTQAKDIEVNEELNTNVDSALIDMHMVEYSELTLNNQKKARVYFERIVARTVRLTIAAIKAGRTIDQSIDLVNLLRIIWDEIIDWLGFLASLPGQAAFTFEDDLILIEAVIFEFAPALVGEQNKGSDYSGLKQKLLKDATSLSQVSKFDSLSFVKTQLTKNYQFWLRFLMKRCGNVDRAKDLFQDGCAKAIVKADQFHCDTGMPDSVRERKFIGWFSRLLINLYIDQIRSAKTRAFLEEDSEEYELNALSTGDNPESIVDTVRQLRSIAGVVDNLTPPQRAALDCIVDGVSYNEMADSSGIPLNSICTGALGFRRKARKAIGE